ncbi:MAG TPA: hypothetical protein VJZ71_00010 [Phycisphaerae bacterium]|nr:hypothetical protein [Phycisphaerae bacterium]
MPLSGCSESARPIVTQPEQSPPIATSRAAHKEESPAPPARPSVTDPEELTTKSPPRRPLRPVDSWVIFRNATDPSEDVLCDAQWTGGNRLQVVTINVTRLTVDLTRLPPGAPRRGPWNLQIDQQGIQITGVRGKVLDLVRSPNGIWAVDREKSPRRE